MSTKNDRLFLITGATGNTGDTTVRLLLQRGHRVRAFVHRSDARSESLAAAGAEIVVGDLLDFHAVSCRAARSHGSVFLLPDCSRPARRHRHLRSGGQRSWCQGSGEHVPDLRTPRGEQQRRAPALDWRTPAGPHRHADGTPAADVLRRMADLVLELPWDRNIPRI